MTSDLLSFVNPLQGTDSTPEISRGNCLPLASMPWAMTAWSPQTSQTPWFFQLSGAKIQGFRATRQPSPWMGDYGQFLVMPQSGALLTGTQARASSYRVGEASFQPHYQSLHLLRYRTTVELVPTERCAVLRFTFDDADGAAKRVLFDLPRGDHLHGDHDHDEQEHDDYPHGDPPHPSIPGRIAVDAQNGTLAGFTRAHAGGALPNFAGYFYAVCSEPVVGCGTFRGRKTQPDATQISGKGIGAYLEFASSTRSAELRVATSYISVEQAKRNLEREIGARSLKELKEQGAQIWNDQLGRVTLDEATDEQRRTFYTCLYRAQLFPHRCHEIDENEQIVHQSFFDGELHPGVAYTDNGFWDTYRTVYPLYSLLYPEQLGEILTGYVAAYRESGWMPQWPSPGHRGCMIGSHIDAVFADAVAKNIAGFDVQTAYEGLRKHAFEISTLESVGRIGLGEYLEHGWIHDGAIRHATSATLDYAYDDWCLAQIAEKLGKNDDRDLFLKRALNYCNVWESSTRWMRARHENGSWVEPFDEFQWGGPFVEGSAWQCGFAVQHDAIGLAQLLGGSDALAERLDQMLALPPHFESSNYGFEIHEMTEMAVADFGQYAHSNQPIHHALFLYAFTSQPWKTEKWTRRVCQELYSAAPDGFAGDEDNGEMASWYVFSALGFYPLTPGHASYVLTSPVFGKATIHMPGGKTFVVEASNNNDENVHVAHRTLNANEYSKRWISHFDIVNGGALHVEMSEAPNENISIDKDDLPYSLSL